MTILRGYIFSRPFFGERAPQHVQNIVLRDYCAQRKFTFLMSGTEYAIENCSLILQQLIDNIDTVDGIVAYSLFQLPADKYLRKKLISQILRKEKSIHFAVETLMISDAESMDQCETIWELKKISVRSPEII